VLDTVIEDQMDILLTGASGYVGAGIYGCLKDKHNTTGTYHSNRLFAQLHKLDITNKEGVLKVVSEVNPEVIIHAAANASGSWCDQNPDLARSINEKGTGYIVDAANKVNAKIIYISSFAALGTTVYGKTKLSGEDYVRKTNAGFFILRPSLIVGYSPNTENDRPFNRLLKNLRERTPARYDTSWKFQPTYLRHISEVILKLIESDISNEIIPVAVPELKSRFDLAYDILSPFGIEVAGEDRNEGSPVFSQDLSKLGELCLPQYSYSEMIEAIRQEIRDKA